MDSAKVDQKLEVMIIPVSDVERAKQFYVSLGWRLDVTPASVVQLTPPRLGVLVADGAPTSLGTTPGSGKGYLVVSDIDPPPWPSWPPPASRSASVSHFGPGLSSRSAAWIPTTGATGAGRGPPTRTATSGCFRRSRPGCPAGSTPPRRRTASVSDVANAMRRAALAHGEHEKRTGQADANWPDWYAAYMVAEQAGTELPT